MNIANRISGWFEAKLIKKLRSAPFSKLKVTIETEDGIMSRMDHTLDLTALLYDLDGNIMAQNAHVGFFNEISSAVRIERGPGITIDIDSDRHDSLTIQPKGLSDVVGKVEVILSIQHKTAVFGNTNPVIFFEVNEMIKEKFDIADEFPYSNNAILITVKKMKGKWYIEREPKAIFGMDLHEYYISKLNDSEVRTL